MSTKTALLGHTGFVGSNILAQRRFDAVYHSKNIGELAGQNFDEIVCAAVSAVKWQANRDPAGDWRSIQPLLDALSQVKADRFVLISTVDVYPNPREVFEDLDLSTFQNHAYGTHRLRVEDFVRKTFKTHYIIRLPGLFGPGLKKNVIFDLLNNRELEVINPKSAFQYYDLARLSSDVNRTIENGLPLLNLATEPVTTEEIIQRFFPNRVVGLRAGSAGFYDFRSRHAGLWGGADGYLYRAATVLEDLGRFLSSQEQYKPSPVSP